jgi:malonyl-CoA/methylmalonyl-CoA synthetase
VAVTLFPRWGRLECEGTTLEPAQLEAAVASVLAQLHRHGLRPGQHVGFFTEPRIETAVVALTCLQGGFVAVPIDPKLGSVELKHILDDAQPQLLLGSTNPPGRNVLAPSLDGERTEVPPRSVDDAPALILYTSGTTGAPKGAVLSTRNLAACIDGLGHAWQWSAADTVVHALPLFHVHGLVLGLFGSQRLGGTLRWVPKFTPQSLESALLQGGRTVLFAVPTMYHRLLEAGATSALQTAHLLVSGSAALPSRDREAIEAVAGQRVVERYGMTETLITCAVRVGSTDEAGRVGPALPGIELRLVGEDRQPLPSTDDTQLGEVAVRGASVFLGYLNRPHATAEVLDTEGWFYTGDMGTLRPDGSLKLVGRKATDLIKCGGFKVGAGEVEGALLAHPSVSEAAVLGVPDPDLGEKIVAFVVLKSPVSTAELQDFVASLLSPHKRPREVQVVPALPRNAMGKVQKQRLLPTS